MDHSKTILTVKDRPLLFLVVLLWSASNCRRARLKVNPAEDLPFIVAADGLQSRLTASFSPLTPLLSFAESAC